MPGTIHDFSVSYDAANEANTFTCGDLVKGRVALQLGKEAKIEYLFVKVTGDADVRWTERHGDDNRTYSAHERYFKLKQMLISEEAENTTVVPGTHVYPFSLKIPEGHFPSAFEGHHGNIRYKLEAKMKRPWKMTKRASARLNFATKLDGDAAQLMSPQFGERDKKMNIFTSGSLSFKAHIEKTGFVPGEMLVIQAEIENSSSRNLKPKYKLDKKVTYSAHSSTKIERSTIFKEEGAPIPSKDHQTVTQELRIPTSIPPSILFCKILRVEYKLKVYIDVPYGSDPEIKFPVIVLAHRCGPRVSGGALGPINNPQWGNHHPGHLRPPLNPAGYPVPPAPAVHPPPGTLPALHPPRFHMPAAYPHPIAPQIPQLVPPQLNAAHQQPPPQYDQVTDGQVPPTAPPLYPSLPTSDFLSAPSAPPYAMGAGADFLSNAQQYPPAPAMPSFLSSPGYDPPSYDMVFPNASAPLNPQNPPNPQTFPDPAKMTNPSS
ncbi:arrestin domain-containing protein 3-like [Engraulis encrasicolus]|uniref:arrestin domain-containing protein 3-like n=1 Tax=Engraulis encrasicolus TaxID=184585 RepID=UPI002FD4A918